MTLTKLKALLPKVCRRDTAYDPAGWSPGNPLAEHCTVVALLVQELFGGELLRVRILPSKRFPRGGWHWFNRLVSGTIVDLTRDQFGDRYPRRTKATVRNRRDVLRIASVRSRYRKLRGRILKIQ